MKTWEQFRSATGTNPDCFMRLFNYLNQGGDCSNIKFYGTSKRLLEEKYTNSEEVKSEKNHKFLDKSIYFWLVFESYCFHGHA